MATKTITIMEDAYELLLRNKIKGESFSEEIRRLLSSGKRKKLSDFFGILSEYTHGEMQNDLREIKKSEMSQAKKRFEMLYENS